MFKGECDLIEAKRGEASRGEARQRKEKREQQVRVRAGWPRRPVLLGGAGTLGTLVLTGYVRSTEYISACQTCLPACLPCWTGSDAGG
jgi:hypothetical protein